MPERQEFVAAATVTAHATASDVWSIWQDVRAWVNWDQGLEGTDYCGEFRAGTRFRLVPHGGEEIAVTLTTVTRDAGFSDEAQLPFGVLRRLHRVEPLGPRVKITHELHAEIDTQAASFFAKEVWPHMQIGLAVSLNNIVGLVESR